MVCLNVSSIVSEFYVEMPLLIDDDDDTTTSNYRITFYK